MTNPGRLILIPTTISADSTASVIPAGTIDRLAQLRYFLAENPRTTRRYLSSLRIFDSIEALSVEVLDKDTRATELKRLFEPLMEGHDVGVLSESGCPGVADPGSLAVRYAHDHGIKVVPLVGPSSILLSLMASGLNGQCFAFQGYLPIDQKEAASQIRRLEKVSVQLSQTQIFIETPYRNKAVYDRLVANLLPDTLLCVAIDVTGKYEFIRCKPVAWWKMQTMDWPKQPAVFLFLAASQG
ncbi:MAG: SAM-dependent methyltransferase [Bacteroidia bacterium]|nr:SAM-dependent methyltransferase [Bacteroidia bacterium]